MNDGCKVMINEILWSFSGTPCTCIVLRFHVLVVDTLYTVSLKHLT